MIQPDEKSKDMSSEALTEDKKRLSRRSIVKKAVVGGAALYVAPQILHSELVRAQGVVSGLAGGGGGGDGAGFLPFAGIPVLGGLAAAGGGGAGAAAGLLPLVGEAPAGGGSPIAPGTTVAEGGIPGAAGTPGSPLGPAGPRATLPPEPLRRKRGLKRKGPQSTRPRKIRGLW